MKEHWLLGVWRKVSKEILRYLRSNNVSLQEAARKNIDMVPVIKHYYPTMASEVASDIRRLGFEITKDKLKKVTLYIINFLEEHGYRCDEDVVKWLYVNVVNLAKEFLGMEIN